MKKLLIGAAFVALGCATAFAQEGPKTSDANPPGAIFAAKSGAKAGRMTTSDVAMKKKKRMSKKGGSMKGNAVGPETGTAKDKASAPAR